MLFTTLQYGYIYRVIKNTIKGFNREVLKGKHKVREEQNEESPSFTLAVTLITLAVKNLASWRLGG